MSACIATRHLTYSAVGNDERRALEIRVFAPFEIIDGAVSFRFDAGAAGCRWEIDGLPEAVADTSYGADSLQALQLACNLEGVLRSLRPKYNLYYQTGEPYFEE
jgi:hypothetical protein